MKPLPHLCVELTPLREISRGEAASIIRASRRQRSTRAHRLGGGLYALGLFTLTTR